MSKSLKSSRTKRIALFGLLLALALVLSYLESVFLSFNFISPGIKLGLPNLVVLIALYMLGGKEAFTLSMLRVAIMSFTYVNLYMMFYSLAGALLSFVVMLLLKKSGRLSIVGVSTAGGVAHNIGQVGVALISLGEPLLYYLPFLLIGGVASGVAIGLLGAVLVKHLAPVINSFR